MMSSSLNRLCSGGLFASRLLAIPLKNVNLSQIHLAQKIELNAEF